MPNFRSIGPSKQRLHGGGGGGAESASPGQFRVNKSYCLEITLIDDIQNKIKHENRSILK